VKRIIRKFTATVIVLAAMAAGMVAFGTPAQADTISNCYNVQGGAVCWVTVDWWEWAFQGANDHWQYFAGWSVS
jgi:hypothetical protein